MPDQTFDLSNYLAAVRDRAAEQRRRDAENEAEAAACRDAAVDSSDRYVKDYFKEPEHG